MAWSRIGWIFLKRLTLVLITGLIIVTLLHVQTGVASIDFSGSDTPLGTGIVKTFRVEDWVKGTTAYLTQLAKGDLGVVLPLRLPGFNRTQPVAEVITRLAPSSLVLLFAALALSLVLGTIAGLLTSRFGSRWLRLPALSASLVLISMPDVLVVMLLRSLVVWGMSEYGIRLFPVTALGGEVTPGHFVLPILALTVMPLAVVARIAAVAFDEVYDQLFIRTATAKGLRPWRIIWKHALKNGWIRVAEASSLILASLLTGLVVVETVLYFPGIGRTLGLFLETGIQPAGASSIALVLLAVAALVDISFQALRLALDPRLREQGQGHRSPDFAPGGLLSALLESLRGPVTMGERLRSMIAGWGEGLREALWRWRPSRLLRLITANRLLLVGLLGVGALLFFAIFGLQFVDPIDRKQLVRFVVVNGELIYPPYPPGTEGFPLGSDLAGRSVLTLLLAGARYTLLFTLAITPVRLALALPWGLAAGFRGGGLWAGLGQSLGLVSSALPLVLVPAVLLQAFNALYRGGASLGLQFWFAVTLVALVGIPRLAETVRQHVEAIAVQPFVEGARAVGARSGRVLWRHIFPNLVPQLWVAAAADMAWTLLLLAQFGVFSVYLNGKIAVTTGYEVMKPTSEKIWVPRIPDWSSMLSKPYDTLLKAPWALWYPALAFLLSIIAFNLVAEGLRRWSQRMTSAVVTEAEPATAGARRRMKLEWAVTAIVLIPLLGYTVRYLSVGQEIYAGAAVQPTLVQARLRMNAVPQLASAQGLSSERNRALGLVRDQVQQYLLHASKAQLTAKEMQEESGDRLRVWTRDQYQIAGLTILDGQGRSLAQAYVVDSNSAYVSYAASPVAVRSAALLPMPEGDHWLLLAGTATESARPAVSLWSGPESVGYKFPKKWEWRPAPMLLEELASRVPGLTVSGSYEAARLEAAEPVTEIKAAPNGDLSFCRTGGECTTLKWTGKGWE